MLSNFILADGAAHTFFRWRQSGVRAPNGPSVIPTSISPIYPPSSTARTGYGRSGVPACPPKERARAPCPEYPVQHSLVVCTWNTPALLRQDRLHHRPLKIARLVTAHNNLLLKRSNHISTQTEIPSMSLRSGQLRQPSGEIVVSASFPDCQDAGRACAARCDHRHRATLWRRG